MPRKKNSQISADEIVVPPIQDRFRETVWDCRVVAIRDDIYADGKFGFFLIGKRMGDDRAQVVLIGSPFNATPFEGVIRQRLAEHGYTL